MHPEERVIASAHIPLSLRRELKAHAEASDRTLSGEIRRGLDFYVRHEYGREREQASQTFSTPA